MTSKYNRTVSVIITTYKREMNILCRAVNSVLNQRYPNIELIIINDFPQYKDIIDEALSYTDKVIIVHNDKNIGACASRNKGAGICSGYYIAFLDDDDEWLPEKIEKEVNQMEEDVGLVYCSGVQIDYNGICKKQTTIYDCNPNPMRSLLEVNCIGGCSYPIIKKEVFDEVGGFDEQFRSCQDYDLWIRIISKTHCRFVDDALVRYYISSDAITSNFDNRVQGYDLLFRRHYEKYKEYPKSACIFLADVVLKCIYNKQFGKALYFANKSFAFFPRNISLFVAVFHSLIKRLL